MSERGKKMGVICNSLLIETYYKSIDFCLDEEFLTILIEEIEKRGLTLEPNPSLEIYS
ncbi:sporulation histidine kinase inhibitor Sda [Halalkalibacter okhensis]|uniref:sporulation histidine kinase inhibitor Sda n=1 Tax=Halalkalibacter okhensis TaxID=333138 RepID=UPI0009FBCD31|nr:sporulation histidine kinase inhibitor Sda [Halalkalibacter okhensis]